MKGSILFNKDINIEVDVDQAAAEGARLISAKNLVDGQELGVGGSDLPVVTSADEGKVLAVNASGEWVATMPSGMVINGTLTESDITMDKTAGEIYQALTNGIVPLLYLDAGADIFLPIVGATLAVGVYTFTFVQENTTLSFSANSADDYPVVTLG